MRHQGSGVGNPAGVARAEEETWTQRSRNMNQGEMVLGMLGLRQVKSRWANDPVCLQNGIIRESGQGKVQAPTPRRKSGGGQRRPERNNNNESAT